MTLVDLIRKRATRVSATATPATSATGKVENISSVAKIAGIAVANPNGRRASAFFAGRTEDEGSRTERGHSDFSNGSSPEAAYKENTNAPATGALPPSLLQASTAMTTEEEQIIRVWLTQIEESDPAVIADVVLRCQHDPTDRNYILRLAADNLQRVGSVGDKDERRTCNQCANLIGRRCLAAQRGEIAASRDYEPVRDILMRCEGYAPKLAHPDRRPVANAGRN